MQLMSFYIRNNQVLLNTTHKHEIFIDFKGYNFIGIIGCNGSGKSTLLKEFLPDAVYGQWIKGEVGLKRLVYLSNDKIRYTVTYHFEPTGDRHSCKGYIEKHNTITGVIEELNPTGSFERMSILVEEVFGLNRNSLQLYKMSAKSIFIAQMTSSERLIYIQNILHGLKDIKKLAVENNDKLVYATKLLKSDELKLSKMQSEDFMKDHLDEITINIKRLNNIIYDIKNSNKKNDEVNEELGSLNVSLARNKGRLAILTDVVSPIIAKYKIEGKSSIITYRDGLVNEIKLQEMAKASILKDIDSIKGKLEKDDMLQSEVTITYTDNESKYLHSKYDYLKGEDIDIARVTSMDTLLSIGYMLDTFINNMNRLTDRYGAITVNEIISRLSEPANVIDHSITSIDEALVNLNSEKSSIVVEDFIYKFKENAVRINKTCDTCKLLQSINDEYENASSSYTKLNELTNKINTLYSDKDRLLNIDSGIKTLNTYIDYFKSFGYDKIKVVLKDFDMMEYVKSVDARMNAAVFIKDTLIVKREYNRYCEILNHERMMAKMETLTEADRSNLDVLLERNVNTISLIDNKIYDNERAIKDIKNLTESTDGESINGFYFPANEVKTNIADLSLEIDKLNTKIEKLRLSLIPTDDERFKSLEDELNREEELANKIRVDIVNRKSLEESIVKTTEIKELLGVVVNSLSKSLIKKVVNKFMVLLKHTTNQLLEKRDIKYKIEDIRIDEKEFTISIFNEIDSVTVPDISMASDGEILMIGTALSFACQDILNIPYNTSLLDEVDSLLSAANRSKFINTLLQFVSVENKQIIAISHNGNFQMYSDNIGIIALRDAEFDKSANNILFQV